MNNLESPKSNEDVVRKAEVFDVPIILDLLTQNLSQNLSEDEKKEGFLTFNPTEESLVEIINDTGVMISLKGSELKGYFITISKELARKDPFWQEMLSKAEMMEYDGKKISEYNYVILGQICIAQNFRGGPTFNRLHLTTQSMLKEKFELGIAEVADTNPKSLAVHSYLTDVGTYVSSLGVKWHILVSDLRKD